MAGVRTPRQKRGQDTWDRLLDAAEELLADEGYEGFTLTAVSGRAGVSNGAIYWRVDSMESLFVAVHERVVARLDAENAIYDEDAPWEGLCAAEVVDRAVHALSDGFRRHERVLRALILRTGSDRAASERGAVAVRDAAGRFTGRVARALAAEGCREPDVVAATIFRVAFGALTARITWPEQEAGPEISWERFVEDLCEMASVYAARHLA
jgi:AcrR family transcriptional regulator